MHKGLFTEVDRLFCAVRFPPDLEFLRHYK